MTINNKGQTLVVFIILIPIIIIVLGIIIDIGLMGLDKVKVKNSMKDAISYGLKNDSSEEEIIDLIDKNIKYESINIDMGDEITIHLTYRYKTVFNLVKNKADFTITGYLDNDQVKYKEG